MRGQQQDRNARFGAAGERSEQLDFIGLISYRTFRWIMMMDLIGGVFSLPLFVAVLAKNFEMVANFFVPAPRDGSPLASSAVRTLDSKLPKDVDK